jgi:hypothetical protein
MEYTREFSNKNKNIFEYILKNKPLILIRDARNLIFLH